MSNQFKKIRIVESNNKLLDYRALEYYSYDEDYDALKKYVEGYINLENNSDIYTVLRVLNWVSNQWEHNGENLTGKCTSLEILKRAHLNEEFSCVEYGKVMADILRSLGIISREVEIKTKDAAYGGFGRNHMAYEIWSNQLQKWFFIDPQFSVYFKHEDNFMNFGEVHELIKSKEFTPDHISLDETQLESIGESVVTFRNEYFEFIVNYIGCINTKINSKRHENLKLLLESDYEILTYQGIGEAPFITTRKKSDFYLEMNQTSVMFSFIDRPVLDDILDQYQIDDEESYLKNLHHFAASPHLNVKCSHNMPNFDYFEYSTGGDVWYQIVRDEVELKLEEEKNELIFRAVSKRGLKGVNTFITILYSY